VNNPLSIIKNYLSVLDSKLARSEPVVGEMSILNEEIDRVGHLISGLADLKPSESEGATDVGKVANEVLRLFGATNFVPPSVQIVATISDSGCEIDGEADILKQVLVNLVKNGVEALKTGGRIEISNRGHVVRDRKLYVDLVVSDNGPGLSAEVLANLFSPVRSAKDGAHHGLGLSIVHTLVTKLHGQISCRSGSAGTSFEMLLPARGAPRPVAAVQARVMDSV
jgi:signal transduction histidine kinase